MKLKRIIRIFCLLGIMLMPLLGSNAYAASGLVVSPKRVVFEKGQRLVEILLANRGDEEQVFRISLVNRAMQENGQLIEAETPNEGEFFAKEVLRSTPRQIAIKPKETQKVRILSRLPADAKDGEYRSHLLIQEIPKAKPTQAVDGADDGNLGVSVTAIFGITLPVILRKGDLSADVTLSAPMVRRDGEDTYLDIAVNRTGTKSIIGTANVFADGQKIGILKNVAVYLSTPRRFTSIKLDPKRAQNLSGKTIRVTFGKEDDIEDAPSAELSFTAP